MNKFIIEWEKYRDQVDQMNMSTKKEIKKSIFNPELDNLIKDKLSEEQAETLKALKDVIAKDKKPL